MKVSIKPIVMLNSDSVGMVSYIRDLRQCLKISLKEAKDVVDSLLRGCSSAEIPVSFFNDEYTSEFFYINKISNVKEQKDKIVDLVSELLKANEYDSAKCLIDALKNIKD
jgi:hypothetical protein